MRYLIRLRNDPVTATLTVMNARVGREYRDRQRQSLSNQSASIDQRGMMMHRIESLGAKVLANPMEQTQLSGIAVIETDDGDAVQDLILRSPDYDVIEDRPISLISPHRDLTADIHPEALDLWHLEHIFRNSERYQNGGAGVVVAVLDTGATEVDEIRGKVVGHRGLDIVNWTVDDIAAGDTQGHGTHVSGLICGDNVGVAPGARVDSIAMIPGGHGDLSHFVLAMEWVGNHPDISILNMSAGIPGYWDGMRDIVRRLESLGVLMVIATGNEGVNQSRSPGNYAEPMSVGASNRDDRVASFSSGADMVVDNMGYSIPDLVAPGAAITSCVMDGGYESWNGTSMATPIVSGIAALHIERQPEILVTDLKENLILSCVDLGLAPKRQGAGLIQA